MEYTLWFTKDGFDCWLTNGLKRYQAEQIAANLNEEFAGTNQHFWYEED